MNSTERGEETRRTLQNFIQQNPGVNKLELKEGTGIGWGTTIYNIDVLKSLKRIRTLDDRGHVHLFTSEISEEEMRYFCALRQKHGESIVAALNERGQVQAYELANELGVSRKVISRAMGHMHRHGLLTRQGRARVLYSLSRNSKEFLAKLRKQNH